jgi:mannose-6-phosphate isomerase
VATLLQCVRLLPGQALFLGAGNMHAYLSGVGVEIMANSDNVLRGGLTPKHVDIEELLNVTNAESGPLPRVAPVDVSAQIFVMPSTDSNHSNSASSATSATSHDGWIGEEWPVPVDDFRLLRLRGRSIEPCNITIETRPIMALCTEGELRLTQGDQSVTLRRGQSAVAGNSEHQVSVSGDGTLFLATAG